MGTSKMRFLVFCVLMLGLCQLGCGDGKLRTKGRIVKDGRDFVPSDGQLIQVTFVPIPTDGEPVRDHYFAEVDQKTGIFRPAGKDGKGMPQGKYRVALELIVKRSDIFKGKYDQVNSPFVLEVDSNTKEIVLDLDNPPVAEKAVKGKPG